MAILKIKATYSLDEVTIRDLERLAKHLGISKSEALRRAIRIAADAELQPGAEQLAALEALQQSISESDVDVEAWIQETETLRDDGYRV